MGMDALTFTGVATYIAEFWASEMISSGLQVIMALAIGGFGLSIIIRAIIK
jgi:hypothetical protein